MADEQKITEENVATKEPEAATPPEEQERNETVAEQNDGGEEVAVAEPSESLLEEAVADAAEEFNVPAANRSAVTVAQDAEPEGAAAEDLESTRTREGFTGEITGPVYSLEDLEDYDGADELAQQREQFQQLVDKTMPDVPEQGLVKGRVVRIEDKDVVIDLGFKSDAFVPKSEFSEELEPGDEVEVFMHRREDYHGQPVVSKEEADRRRRWQRIEHAYENEDVLEGTIIRRIKGGMIVDLLDGLEAFLPGSQIDVRPVRDFDAYLEKRMEFKIVKINEANENVVISHKALIQKELEAQREKILSTMEVGQVLEGTVKNIVDFGVFIDLGGVDGLLHITDLSWGRVSHPSELVDLDEKLKVVVLDYDKERQRISLGLKQLQPHPWENIDEKFSEGDTVEGKVVSITDYGAFVELEKGIEGLVHISEMSWTDHIRHPSQKVSLGQLVNVKILNIDHEGKKISLGMKQLEDNPWEGLSDRYPPGTVLRGKVRNITNFGVFVEIEPGIDGLVHISDLSWTKKIRHPGEMINKGQELDVVILDIDEDRQRISLGHKQVSTNPWNQFAEVYSEGTDHTAVVNRVENKGLIVELPLGAEAFVPGSELKNGPQNFQSHYHEEDELELQVIRFDMNKKEIILSETAKDRAEEIAERREREQERREERQRERREVSRFKKRSEQATGPTTLGELSGLADLKAQMEEVEQTAEEAEEPAAEEVQEADATAEESPESEASEAAEDAAEDVPGEDEADETDTEKES